MQTFTGLEYLYISFANHYGLDKATWADRLKFAKSLLHGTTPYKQLVQDIDDQAIEPILANKAFNAIVEFGMDKPTGFMASLDATASGLQILACLMGCHETAKAVNLIDTGSRSDVYTTISDEMNVSLGCSKYTRKELKQPIMTTFYNSQAQPKKIFGEGTPELEAYYQVIQKKLGGAWEAMQDIQSCWRDNVLVNEWTLPDGHKAHVPVMVEKSSRIEVDLGNGKKSSFTYQTYVNGTTDYDLSLPANIVQSIDAYVVREMHRRAYKQGFQLHTIHDSFWAHPNYMNLVRQNYRNILADIASSHLLQSILREITSKPNLKVIKRSKNLAPLIRKGCEYALS